MFVMVISCFSLGSWLLRFFSLLSLGFSGFSFLWLINCAASALAALWFFGFYSSCGCCGFYGLWLLWVLASSRFGVVLVSWFLRFRGFCVFFPSLSLCACLREELTDVFNRNLLYNYFYLICVSQQITGEKRGWLLHMTGWFTRIWAPIAIRNPLIRIPTRNLPNP